MLTNDLNGVKVKSSKEKNTREEVNGVTDYSKLRGRIIERFGKYARFAEHINVSAGSVSLKLNGNIQFSKADMELWGQALDIPRSEYCDYFF